MPARFSSTGGEPPQSLVVGIGHFGNFELYARFGQFYPAFQCATTYRGLRQPSLNRLLQSLRGRSGCQFFERRFDAPLLRAFMNKPGVMLGLLSDQHAGNSGLRLPFLGHDCSTSAALAIFALRYHCSLRTGICYRVGLAQWRIEAGEEIPKSLYPVFRDRTNLRVSSTGRDEIRAALRNSRALIVLCSLARQTSLG